MQFHEAWEYLMCPDPGELEGGAYKVDSIEGKSEKSLGMGTQAETWSKGLRWSRRPRQC